MVNTVHLGHIVKKKFEESGLSITQLAATINRTRTTIYDIFERKSIDIDLLIQLSEALHFDFIHEIYLPLLKAQKKRYFVGVEVSEEELQQMDLRGKVVFTMERPREMDLESDGNPWN